MSFISQSLGLVFQAVGSATSTLKSVVQSSGMLWHAFLMIISALFIVNIVFGVISDRIRGGIVLGADSYIPKAKNSKRG